MGRYVLDVIVGRSQLARLTAGKAIGNTALRWIPFFLFELERAFDATTAQLTTILGVGEMAGLFTLLVGRQLDGGKERWFMSLSLGFVSVSALMALSGSLPIFAASFFLLIIGVSLYTVGGHTYLSRRVPFQQRGRVIGIFETSWAMALLIGAPIVAVLLRLGGWRAPFVFIAIVAALCAVLVATTTDHVGPTKDATGPPNRDPLGLDAWLLIAGSAAIAMAGLTTIVIVGTWLEDAFDVSVGGVGALAFAFGVAELGSSSSSAVFADRLGAVRTTRMALVGLVVGIVVMTQASTSLIVAILGLFIFFLGFEYSIVTSFSFVSEAAPAARGRVLAANNAIGTLARGTGTIASGLLFERFGISGPVAVSFGAAVLALGLLTVSQRRTQIA